MVLIDFAALDRVADGEAWYVKLRHRDTFAVADPVEKVTRASLESSGGLLSTPLADTLRRATSIRPAGVGAVPAPCPEAPPQKVATSGAVANESNLRTPGGYPASSTSGPVDLSRLLRASDRLALFIDGANTDGAARAAGYFVDFRRARDFFLANATFYAAFYYVADFTA